MKERELFAHSRNAAGQRHSLLEHIRSVSSLAASFAEEFGGQELAYWIGVLHDIGKFHPEWQSYLLAVEADASKKGTGPDHKGAGAVLIVEQGLPTLALLIQGHHGGLTSPRKHKDWLKECKQDPHVAESIALAKLHLPELQQRIQPAIPPFIQTRLEVELYQRMLFSALVDADSLDAEAHFKRNNSALRQIPLDMAHLLRQFEIFYRQFADPPQTSVNRVRASVYHDCVHQARNNPGFYRLTVPTGGGKTLASLAFSLHHAVFQKKKRLIYAIPYMSITEQTARVFREIFSQGVLEHHSGLLFPEAQETLTRDQVWQRLAAENWDAPIIVTTTVQLFESLFSRKPSTCRKLHNIAGSVIVLDEVQMLPTNVLEPILDGLRELVAHYGVTVVLCTATQPALHARAGFQGLPDIQEIVPDAQKHFEQLKRVEYQILPDKRPWQTVAHALCQEYQVLAIVNTRAHAQELVKELQRTDVDPLSVFHLSTRMCGAHRRHTLQQIQIRLDKKKPQSCHVISTQLIEAGVDIDFPCVWRALGPLDRLVQAAGRANREGLLAMGRVIIFEPEEEGLPRGPYQIGTKLSRALLQTHAQDLHQPSLFLSYFEELFAYVSHDEKRIQAARRAWDYEEVAEHFQLIENGMISVIVQYSDPEEPARVERLLHEMHETLQDEKQANPSRMAHLSRLLRPYLVNISKSQFDKVPDLLEEVWPDVWVWRGTYDAVQGLMFPDELVQNTLPNGKGK